MKITMVVDRESHELIGFYHNTVTASKLMDEVRKMESDLLLEFNIVEYEFELGSIPQVKGEKVIV